MVEPSGSLPLRWQILLLLMVLATPAEAQSLPPRWQLAAAFVKRDSLVLRRYLAPDVMIWPPAPDTARRGTAAINYFVGLAMSSRVSQSEFRPRQVSSDGNYLVEDGIWSFTHQRAKVRARYDLRWRNANGRWQVSFLKWDLFR
jgi:hypothetical protein